MFTQIGRTLALGAAVVGLAAAASPALASGATHTSQSSSFSFATHGDNADVTFNQLLGINDQGQIAGYFGSGADVNHPNKGYVVNPPYYQHNFTNENFPGSAQTQVIGINNSGTTVGFYADPAGDNFGFVLKGGIWTAVIDPQTPATSPQVNQLLGVNNSGIAVGFYTDGHGNNHGYEFNFHNNTFQNLNLPGASSLTATGINNNGDVTGFFVNHSGATQSFLLTGRGHLVTFNAPGSTNTMALGINNSDEIVGSYATGSGDTAMTHGFVWQNGHLRTVDDPHGLGTTTINGVNDNGTLVGFYVDGGGNTDGFVAQPN